ncbi:MAG: hypothetical protein V4448_05795 [Pseudomonadota bacterium]
MKSIDIPRLIELKSQQINILDVDLDALKKSLLSIDMRQRIGFYHFENWMAFKDEKTSAYLVNKINQTPARIDAPRLNAEVFGFLQNLHAVCDSFPYILNLIIKRVDIEDSNVGWSDKFLKNYVTSIADYQKNLNGQSISAPLSEALTAFQKNEYFAQLKGVVNKIKHKYLIPIMYDKGIIYFETYSYRSYLSQDELLSKAIEKFSNLESQDVEKFIVNCHDKLWPDLCDLFDLLIVDMEMEQ